MTKLDITKTNDAVDELLAVTTNPRHRFLLETYHRHRFLEMAGRYSEIFAPEMTVANPVYHFNALGINATLSTSRSSTQKASRSRFRIISSPRSRLPPSKLLEQR
jgi:hypothetical protein